MPVLGIDLAIHLPIELGIDLAGGAVAPPAVEAPELVTGLKAWFDSRSAAYFTLGGGGEVSAWLARAGSLGGILWTQSTGANQPIRVASVPTFNNLPAVLFDGVNDALVTSNSAAWTFAHNGTGHSQFRIYRVDSTGGTTQITFSSHGGSSNTTGFLHGSISTSTQINIGKGVAPSINGYNSSAGNHHARDVTKWHMLGHVTGNAHTRVSGSSLSPADTSSPPASGPSTSIARLGQNASSAAGFLKGWIAQDMYYDHVLTTPELTQLVNWAVATYGVAA